MSDITSSLAFVAEALSSLGRSKADTSPTLPTEKSEPSRSFCQSPNNTTMWPQETAPSVLLPTQHEPQRDLRLPSWHTPLPAPIATEAIGKSVTSFLSGLRIFPKSNDSRGPESRKQVPWAGSEADLRDLEEGKWPGGWPSGGRT